MKLIRVENTPANSDKKFVAVFCKCPGRSVCSDADKKRIEFGQKGSNTYLDGATNEVRDAYLTRHRANENWNTINRGSLSRWINWSSRSMAQAIRNFKANVTGC